MKKVIAFVLIMITAFSFAGCGNGEVQRGTFEGLSYGTERQICEAYYEWRHADFGLTKEFVNIRHYWGTYNGCPAVEMTTSWGCADFLFDGVFFQASSVLEILIFKDNKFVDIVDAYNDGFLTREDLRSIQAKRAPKRDASPGYYAMLNFEEKTAWEGSIDEDFDDQTIIVTILKQFSDFTFKCALEKRDGYPFWENNVGDFKSISAVSVNKINGDKPRWSEETKEEWEAYRQVLEVKIANKGKQNVIDAIRRLEDFDFVQSAAPKYF